MKLSEWTVLGRVIGKASGWDQADTFSMMLYDFSPAPGVDLPSGTLNIDFERGVVETFDEAGQTVVSHDIVSALAHMSNAEIK
jgi:hypothetical protein